MVNQELLDYIKRQHDNGANADNIKEALLKAGWEPKDVESAIASTFPVAPVASAVAPAVSAPVAAPVTMPVEPVQVAAPQQPVAAPVLAASVASPIASPQYVPPIQQAVAPQMTMQSSAPAVNPVVQAPVQPIVAPLGASFSTGAVAAQVAQMMTGAMPTTAGAVIGGTPVQHAVTGGVQIPSANFMPKVAPTQTGPVVTPVTSVMPNAAVLPPVQKSKTGMIVAISVVSILVLAGGGFAYWKYTHQTPPPIPPSLQPVVQDVIVTPDAAPVAPEGGMIAFPSSIQATTSEDVTATTTEATTTGAAKSAQKSATSTLALPPSAI